MGLAKPAADTDAATDDARGLLVAGRTDTLHYGPDYVFGSLAVAHMGTLGTFCGYVEAFEVRAALMRQEGMVEVLHGYKDLYSDSPSAEEEALLGPLWRSRLQL